MPLEITEYPCITLDFIDKYPDKSCWDWNKISEFQDLTIDFVIKYKDKKWDFNKIIQHPNIEVEDLIKFCNNNKNYRILEIGDNPNINMEIVKNKRCFWWSCLSENPSIKLEDITNNPEEPWQFRSVSRNPNLYPRKVTYGDYKKVKSQMNIIKEYENSIKKILDPYLSCDLIRVIIEFV